MHIISLKTQYIIIILNVLIINLKHTHSIKNGRSEREATICYFFNNKLCLLFKIERFCVFFFFFWKVNKKKNVLSAF